MSLVRPVVASTTPPQLKYGGVPGGRLIFKGVTIYGVDEGANNSGMVGNYNNRTTILNTLASWSGNIVRLRVHSPSYAALSTVNKAAYIQRVKDWRDGCVAKNIYLMLCDFVLTSPANIAWSGTIQTNAKTLYTDIFAALGNDPGVIYEPYNEPNQDSFATWQTYMKDLQTFFRTTLGYTGLLVIDPINWANSSITGAGFSNTDYTALETFDAGLAGMSGQHQLAFAKHDYASIWTNQLFNSGTWQNTALANTTAHLIFQTEFGDFNAATQNDAWTQHACSVFASQSTSMPNYCGATAFQWNWQDNSMTPFLTDYVTPTTYGTSVRDLFLNPFPKTDPTSIPNLVAWWKADAITGVPNAAVVATWPDASGNGRDAVQAGVDALKPTYATNVQGLPAVHFVSGGGGQYLTSNADDSFGNRGVTAFAVVAPGAAGANPPILGASGAGGFMLRFNASTLRPEAVAITTGTMGVGTSALPLSNWGIVTFDYVNNGAGSAFHHFLNGAANGNSTSGVNYSAGLSMWLGGYYQVNSFLTGWISEVVVYNRVLSASERARVHTYLDDKYGVSYRANGSPNFGASDYIGRSSVRKSGAWKRSGSKSQKRVSGAWTSKPQRLHRSGIWTPA